MLAVDAKWLCSRGDGWLLAANACDVFHQGTLVVLLGSYNFRATVAAAGLVGRRRRATRASDGCREISRRGNLNLIIALSAALLGHAETNSLPLPPRAIE
jgi:hypothetical protein